MLKLPDGSWIYELYTEEWCPAEDGAYELGEPDGSWMYELYTADWCPIADGSWTYEPYADD